MRSKIALRRSRTPLRISHEQSTGSKVRVTISEPISAKIIVSAIGLNSTPDGPGEDVDRKEADDDDDDRIEERPVDLGRGVADDRHDAVRPRLALGKAAVDILDHDHRGIDEDAEIDRADRQQVRRRILEVEAGEGEQQRQAES